MPSDDRLKELLLQLQNLFRSISSSVFIHTPHGPQDITEHKESTFVQDGQLKTEERLGVHYLDCNHYAQQAAGLCEFETLLGFCHRVCCEFCLLKCSLCLSNVCHHHGTIVEEKPYCRKCAARINLRKAIDEEESRWDGV